MANFEQREVCGFLIGRTLGKGMSGKVKLGVRKADGVEVALKFIDRSQLQAKQMAMLAREVQAMNVLSHPNVLTLLQVEEEVDYPRKRGGVRSCVMLVLELSQGGELFDYLMHTGPFDDVLARTYFRSMLAALELCHSKGIYHRDIKPENLLVSGDFSLKLADFGLASVNTDAVTLCSTECGTRSYMSPEVMCRKPYDGAKADIWSAGVVLFILISGFPPFQVAGGNDWWYRACNAGRHDKFWQAHLRSCPKFPPLAQELLNGIFTVDPAKRISIDEIWESEWMQGPVLSDAELFEAMSKRTAVTLREKEKELMAAQAEKARAAGQTFDPYAANTYRSMQSDETEAAASSSLADAAFLVRPNEFSALTSALTEALNGMGAYGVKTSTEKQFMKASIPLTAFAVNAASTSDEKEADLDSLPDQPPSMTDVSPAAPEQATDAQGALHIEFSFADLTDDSKTTTAQRVSVRRMGGSGSLFRQLISSKNLNLQQVFQGFSLVQQSEKSEEVLLETAEDDLF